MGLLNFHKVLFALIGICIYIATAECKNDIAVETENLVTLGQEEKTYITHDKNTCKVQDTFQCCVVECIDTDICCSCKESGRKSMLAALVNTLTKDCAMSDITTCAPEWVKATLESNISNGASNCTKLDTVSSSVQQCANKCSGRPLSNPLNPKRPSLYTGILTSLSDLSNLPNIDLTDFCQAMRAEGLLCTSYRADTFTAGNSMCRSDNICGYHGKSYSWCYVDSSNNWDYCCTGSCDFHGNDYLWCDSGNQWQYCGKGGNKDIQGRQCLAEYPCGMHQEFGKTAYFWCYVDVSKNWDRCCEPNYPCDTHGYDYNWCFTGYESGTDRQRCQT